MTRLSTNSRTRRPSKLIALLGAALMAGTGAAYAQAPAQGQGPAGATQAGPATPGAQRGDGPRMGRERGGREQWRGHRGPRGGHHGQMMRMFSPAKVAGALSAIETGIGVQPDQMEAWRTFTAALVAFADGAQPPHMGPRRGGVRMMPNAEAAPEAPGESDDAALEETIEDQVDLPGEDADETVDSVDTADDADDTVAAESAGPGFIMLDRMADRAIEQGERAETLKTALAELQQTLTPQQIDSARSLVRSMMREARAERRAEMRERRGGRDGKPHHGEHRKHGEDGKGKGPKHDRD
ncbi:MAG: hypothetical protein V7704_02410 [Aurantimonas endophytica]|uniref:LTXXQ motif family protein n=1 Tax=Aurantimonas endophytica TaxID=1522175 RepID=A0A7W6MQZ6_9HYPH|nr:hypothetical protein [Aurantimonas endophytica]MBB4004489.1 hypothetical protein [Aurantimonas endophytica]MCO6405325.1 hypothetical protein [Aurantimonas endophytica]